MGLVQPSDGLMALAFVLNQPHAPVVAAVPFYWNKLAQQAAQHPGSTPSIFNEIIGHMTQQEQYHVMEPLYATAAPSATPAAVGVMDGIQTQTAEILRGILGTDIAPDEPLMAAGLDSLASVEFRNALEAQLCLSLPATLIFDHPTVSAIAEFLSAKLPAAAQGAGAEGHAHVHAAAAAAAAVSVQEVESVVMTAAVDIVGDGLQADQPLMAAGLDSLGAVELRNALQGKLGLELPSTLIFDYPTASSVAQFIAGKLKPMAATQASSWDMLPQTLHRSVDEVPTCLMVCSIATRSPKVCCILLKAVKVMYICI